MIRIILKYITIITTLLVVMQLKPVSAIEFSDHTFIIAEGSSASLNSNSFWQFLETNNNSGIEIDILEFDNRITLTDTNLGIVEFLNQIQKLIEIDDSKIIPLFLTFQGNIEILDSIISNS
ncbi:MAG: hypothetical protein KAH68_03280, partial [Draconibacterium sp.]|nr:hypothetical protein [Draconibacterium sp.]